MFKDETVTLTLPMRGSTLAEQVYRHLAAGILSGSFAPLERINLRQHAEELNVSVTPVREAVQRLVSEGVLEATDKNTILVPERSEPEIREIFDIRRALEGDMAEKSAPLLDSKDVLFLRQTHAAYLSALGAADYKEALRFNSLFHFRIYERANLPVRLKIIESLWLRIGPTLRHMYPVLQQERTDHKRHEAIIANAASQDPAGLRSAIVGDLVSSQAALNRYAREYAGSDIRTRTTRRLR